MKKKNYRGTACTKRSVAKCIGVCRTFGILETAYADRLSQEKKVKSFQTNIPICGEFMTDFLICKKDGTMAVRECVYRKILTRASTLNRLDISKKYWEEKGIIDWGIVTNVCNE